MLSLTINDLGHSIDFANLRNISMELYDKTKNNLLLISRQQQQHVMDVIINSFRLRVFRQ